MAFVHPDRAEFGAAVAGEYGLQDLPRFADPDGILYRACGLGRARVWQFLTRSSLRRYWQAWRAGHRGARPTADVLRMPGAVVLHRGEIVRAFRPRGPAERVDYRSLLMPAQSE
ncbi:MAG: AhpC/TSA family protein [Planctomycetia bacterium]|nr:AhpC/TSA family protein [Planctomycetia bacterium]